MKGPVECFETTEKSEKNSFCQRDGFVVYSYETSITVRSHIMRQNADFQEGISQA